MYNTLTATSRLSGAVFILLSAAGLTVFAWPLIAGSSALNSDVAVTASLLVIPAVAIALVLAADRSLRTTHALALVGVLAAVAALARVLSTGFGGFELVFVVVILAGRALGARQGFVVGVLALALSSLVWGGFGPWTAYQMIALGWVGAGAGLLPRAWGRTPGTTGRVEVAILAVYGAIVAYVFGILMNLWFWPLAVGPETSISLVEGAGLAENLASFAVYTLATSTLTWDTVRALTTVVTLALIGRPALRALRRVHERA